MLPLFSVGIEPTKITENNIAIILNCKERCVTILKAKEMTSLANFDSWIKKGTQ